MRNVKRVFPNKRRTLRAKISRIPRMTEPASQRGFRSYRKLDILVSTSALRNARHRGTLSPLLANKMYGSRVQWAGTPYFPAGCTHANLPRAINNSRVHVYLMYSRGWTVSRESIRHRWIATAGRLELY